MRHLFVGAWNLSAGECVCVWGGLGCIKNFHLSSAPKLSLPVRRPSQSFTTFACSPVHLWNSLSNTNKPCSPVLQDSLLLSLVTKSLGKGSAWLRARTVGPPTYSISQKLSEFFVPHPPSFCSGSRLTRLVPSSFGDTCVNVDRRIQRALSEAGAITTTFVQVSPLCSAEKKAQQGWICQHICQIYELGKYLSLPELMHG